MPGLSAVPSKRGLGHSKRRYVIGVPERERLSITEAHQYFDGISMAADMYGADFLAAKGKLFTDLRCG